MNNQEIIDEMTDATPCEVSTINANMSSIEIISKGGSQCNNEGVTMSLTTLATEIDNRTPSDLDVLNNAQLGFIFREIPGA